MTASIYPGPATTEGNISLPSDTFCVTRSLAAWMAYRAIVMIVFVLIFYSIIFPPNVLPLPLFPPSFWGGIVGAVVVYTAFVFTSPAEGLRFKSSGFLLRTEGGRRFFRYNSLKSAVAHEIGEKQILVQLSARDALVSVSIVFPVGMRGYYYPLKRALMNKGIDFDENFRTLPSSITGKA